MSYQGGGYRRKHHHRGQDDSEHREVHESADQKLKLAILKLGEVDPIQELPRLASQIREQSPLPVSTVAESFRIGVTEQPFKIPYYATLLRLLHDPVEADALPSEVPLPGRQILEDFWKSFQAFLDKLAWREIRLCIHFFAHLTVARVVSLQSMHDLLRTFIVVLDEFGVSHGRAKQAVRCASEGLMIASPLFRQDPSVNISDIIAPIKIYVDTSVGYQRLVQPLAGHLSNNTSAGVSNELLDSALSALESMDASNFSESFPRPYAELPSLTSGVFELPSVLVPPEVIELDGLSNDGEALVKKEEWAEFHMRLFSNDVTPNPTTLAGYTIRCGLSDLIDIFEVNRKECARLLLEYPKWTLPGTFQQTSNATALSVDKHWQLECTIIENILGSLFLLPQSTHKSVYYISLITELCKLSPSSVGPAVGKSIRRMYSLLSDGLDVEIGDRLASWFSIHMSNFNFQWVWKEWVEDLALSLQHPKRVFMRRAAEYEIRLSYYDRILRTLPERMQSPDACVMPEEAPGPTFEYDDPASPHYEAAQSVLNLFRGRAKAEDVMAHLEELKNSLDTADSDQNVTSIIRSIAVQSLLHIGSRSFSHFLNAIERYLPLLRNLAAGGISASGGTNMEARSDILSAVLAFWKHSKHMVVIVFDKLMQYQIVDPTDVISWTFLQAGTFVAGTRYRSCSSFQWDLIKGALDKANGRVAIARRRVTALRKEEDDNAARAKANDGATMEIDNDTKPSDPVVESPVLTSALKAFASLTREQKAALAQTLDGFADCLVSQASSVQIAREVLTEASWNDRANWGESEWLSWETWAWYRHFCRTYSPYLRNYSTTLGTVAFANMSSSDPAVELFRRTWNMAVGQEI